MPAPVRTHTPLHTSLRLASLAALLLAVLALTVEGPGNVAAQSATPVASANCAAAPMAVAPEVPTSLGDNSTATPTVVVAVDPATGAAITQVIDSLTACLTSGDAETVTLLVTDRYLADAYGGGERMTKEDYIALAPLAPVVPVTVVSVGEIDFNSQDTATTQVVTIQGNQLRTEEWTFLFRRDRQPSATPIAEGDGHWLVHQVTLLDTSAPADASTAKVVQQAGSIKITPSTLKGPDVVFTVQNADGDTHEFLALRLVEGATLDQLIRPTSDVFPRNIEVIGQETIPAGETRTLVFVGLEPGTYTVVCLLPDGDGVPHLALGESATFTIS